MNPEKTPSLRTRVLRAGGLSMAGYGVSQAIRLGSTLIMTRLLVPEMFGVMAIASMVSVIINLLSDIGLRENIVQSRRGDDPLFLDTAWVLQILRGLGCCVLALLVSVLIHFANLGGLLPAHSAYASPMLPSVIAVSSISAVILGFESTKIATAYRALDQRRVIQIELVGQTTAFLIMIAIGLATHSIWALVAAALVESLARTTLSHLWMSGAPNRFRWDRGALAELVRFGKWILMSSIMHLLAVTGDRMLLGFMVGADVLGFYSIASQMVRAIQGASEKLFSAISLPALSEVARKEPARLRDVYYRMRVPVDIAMLFMMAGLFAAGQFLIDLLFDGRYSAVGGMLQVLSLSLFVARYGIASQIYLAMGLPRYVAATSLARAVSLYSLVPALYYLVGLQAAIWGVALHGAAMLPFIFYFNAKLKVNDARKEIMVLLVIPVGYFCGAAVSVLGR